MTIENNSNKITIAPGDDTAINGLLEKLGDAWARGDGQAYASLFLEDARFVGAPGFRLTGNKMIGEEHQEMFDGIFKFSRIDGKYDREMQALTPDVVLVHSYGNVFFPGESEKNAKSTGLTMICLLKRNGIWKIASFQNTRTGKFGGIKFIWRFLFSRIHLFRAHRI
jgi:uncharacterized protein (TIGR02246 family)